jgi:hypothetical protein
MISKKSRAGKPCSKERSLAPKKALLQRKPCSKEALLQRKKSRAGSPALKIVSTLFPRKFGFDLD